MILEPVAGEGRSQGFLTLNQHLTGFLIQQRHLAGLDRLGCSPLQSPFFVGANSSCDCMCYMTFALATTCARTSTRGSR
jgi:hypothetical protein